MGGAGTLGAAISPADGDRVNSEQTHDNEGGERG